MRTRTSAGGLMAAACIALASTSALAARLAIRPQIVPSKSLAIWTAYAEDKGDFVIVHGYVKRPLVPVGIVPGHIHVVAHRPGGLPDVIADTRWGSTSRLATYSARLPIADASTITDITVSYVPTSDVADTNSGSEK